MTNGLSKTYNLDESNFSFRGNGSRFSFLLHFSMIITFTRKLNSARLDAALCGVESGAVLFAYVPLKGSQVYTG